MAARIQRIFWLACAVLCLGLTGCREETASVSSSESQSSEPAPAPDPELLEFPTTVFGTLVEKRPESVVCLSPAMTEILYDLGYDEFLIGVSSFCDYPEEARNKIQVGSPLSPDLELLEQLDPEWILTQAPLTREMTSQLEKRGIQVLSVSRPEDWETLLEFYRGLSVFFEGEATGGEIGAEICGRLEERWTLDTGKERERAILVIGLPDQIAEEGTFENEVLEAAGFWNLGKEDAEGREPDVIFFSDEIDPEACRGYYEKTKAAADGRMYPIDITVLERQSFRMFDLLEEMAHVLL